MNKLSLYMAGAVLMLLPTSCIEEFTAQQNGYVTKDQTADAPGAYDNFVSAIIDNLNGQFTFTGSSYQKPNDFGYSSFYLERDVMGNDLVTVGATNNWFMEWYEGGVSLGAGYLNAQYPWSFYYSQIRSCNTVLGLAGENPDDTKKVGAGIAITMRSLYYLELAQMFAPQTYRVNKDALTVPILTENTENSQATSNPRATNEEMYDFIISSLDRAEELLADFQRSDKYTPDLSVVYGIKARTYLIMCDWANAEKYAKLAAQGYEVLTADQYTDRNNGFNNANWGNSWMFAIQVKPTDPCQTYNDGDNSWGTWMICEFPVLNGGLGYYNAYGASIVMDRHLYETVPATDCRKKCFLDFTIDEMETEAEVLTALAEYSDVPEYLIQTGLANGQFGGLSLKFRSKGGNHSDPQYVGWCVDIPVMRVEEMKLIEAEAAGMQDEGRGKALLEAFAKTRDPQYVYGKHNESYYNTTTPAFQNEIWWQRRIEFWGEGLATFDIKRLEKGIIRSYPNSNHIDGYRWNMEHYPNWMNLCITQTESNYNLSLVNNPAPQPPTTGNSPEYKW